MDKYKILGTTYPTAVKGILGPIATEFKDSSENLNHAYVTYDSLDVLTKHLEECVPKIIAPGQKQEGYVNVKITEARKLPSDHEVMLYGENEDEFDETGIGIHQYGESFTLDLPMLQNKQLNIPNALLLRYLLLTSIKAE